MRRPGAPATLRAWVGLEELVGADRLRRAHECLFERGDVLALGLVDLDGYTVIGDRGLSGAEIEELVALLGGVFLRPDRRDEAPRFGNLGGVRQWIEAIFDQLKDQLSLERHGAHTIGGLCARVAQRLLALGACVWHNWEIGEPGRSLIAYDH